MSKKSVTGKRKIERLKKKPKKKRKSKVLPPLPQVSMLKFIQAQQADGYFDAMID